MFTSFWEDPSGLSSSLNDKLTFLGTCWRSASPSTSDSQRDQHHLSSLQSKDNLPADISEVLSTTPFFYYLAHTKIQLSHFHCHQIQGVTKFSEFFLNSSLLFYFPHYGCNSGSCFLSGLAILTAFLWAPTTSQSVCNSSCLLFSMNYSSGELQISIAHSPVVF